METRAASTAADAMAVRWRGGYVRLRGGLVALGLLFENEQLERR